MKVGKSRKTCLINYTWPISCHWLLIPSGVDTNTHTDTHIPTCEQKPFQETRHVRPSAVHAWFKKSKEKSLKTSQGQTKLKVVDKSAVK